MSGITDPAPAAEPTSGARLMTTPAAIASPVPRTERRRRHRRWRASAQGFCVSCWASAGHRKELTRVASSLTFTTVLATVPMLAVVLALFTAFPLFADFHMALEIFLVKA